MGTLPWYRQSGQVTRLQGGLKFLSVTWVRPGAKYLKCSTLNTFNYGVVAKRELPSN